MYHVLQRIGRAGNVGYTSIWCDIIKEMDRLASHGIDLISMMHKKIENELNTSFWEDRWWGEQRLKEAFSRIYALEVNKHISVAFKFEQTSLSSSLRRMPRSGIESEQWDHLLDSLEGVMLNPSEDRWSWDLNGSGEFSVASARRYIDNNRLPDISSKTRWIKEVPIKVNVHAWKASHVWQRVGIVLIGILGYFTTDHLHHLDHDEGGPGNDGGCRDGQGGAEVVVVEARNVVVGKRGSFRVGKRLGPNNGGGYIGYDVVRGRGGGDSQWVLLLNFKVF
nr:RNA-directed DNA polymerase, eukaryota, reverse transcriptase zinc-binding domain protein [Tanacetum cinerariifolium]